MVPRIAILILCFNGRSDTLACLGSLAQLTYPSDRVDTIIIDNASTDGTSAAVQSRYPNITLIETKANLGFAAGNNAGLHYVLAHGYDYVLLLNNDTEVAPDLIEQLVSVAESEPAIGVVGPTICYYNRPDIIWSAGGHIDWQHGTSSMNRLGLPIDTSHTQPKDVDFVSGCALLCKCAILEQIGLLDERFFMYYEETEWCVRATRAGFRIVHAPQARVLHKIPLDARAEQPYVAYYMTRNRLLFLQVAGAGLAAWINATLFQDLRTCLSLSLRPKWQHRRHHRNAMIHAWRDFLRGRYGCWELS